MRPEGSPITAPAKTFRLNVSSGATRESAFQERVAHAIGDESSGSSALFSGATLIRFSQLLAFLVGSIALAALVGWMFDIAFLKAAIPGRPPMLLSVAAEFLLASVALLLLTSGRQSSKPQRAGRLLAIFICVLGFLGAADSGSIRITIENLIASLLPFKTASIQHDPAIRSGITPIFFAAALLLFQAKTRRSQRIFQILAFLPIMISLLALIGHAYHVPNFYGWTSIPLKTPVSLPGAIASVLFGTALLAGRPELEWTRMFVSPTVGGYVARRLLLAPVVIPVLNGLVQVIGRNTEHYIPDVANWFFSFSNIFVFTLVIGWISLLLYRTDLTRKKAEESLHEFNENLEEQVRKRTNDLTEANLRLEQEIEERKKTEGQLLRAQRVECLGALAGGIAHDLNNMLAPILMAAPLLEDEVKGDSKHYLDLISQSAQRGSDLIKQIMIFARGTKGEMQQLNVRRLMRDLQKTLEATLPRSIQLQTIMPEELEILGDPTQVWQVLMNLCINARDAMPNGGTLMIKAEGVSGTRHGSARMVQIEVADTGIGIPREHLLNIFDPFFTTKAPGKGTGLGLATVKRIIESHRGGIRVESHIGKGTTFFVTFPRAGRESIPEPPSALEYLGHGEHILVVEDELALREILQATLEHAHYRVTVTSNGIEALEAARKENATFDLVVTDFEMPFMTGRMLVEQLATHLPSTRFVVMTGSLDATGEQEAVNAQWRLRKPFTTQVLLQTVHQAISSQNTG
jgi:signal transduction histidine kinase/CheY-like chemotaxis protein